MTSTKDLYELGKELGFEGEALFSFIKDEQTRERELRQEEREKRQEENRLLELQLQVQQARNASEREEVVVKTKGPTLPRFDENKDD